MTKKEIYIIIFLVCVAFLRYLFFIPEKPAYESAVGKSVSVSGSVAYPPDVRLSNTRIVVSPDGQKTNILIVVPNGEGLFYGDKLKLSGVLETPDNFLTTSGKEFDYKRYLANQDIYYIIRNPKVEIISHGNGSRIYSSLYYLRDRFSKSIDHSLFPPESDLAEGLLLGTRGGFDSNMRDEFISTGTIHIVALSGYNVTIVAEGIMKVLGIFLAQTLSIIFGILVVFLFIIMAGASATSIRAGIMATIALIGRMTGRSYDAGRALVIALLLMVAYDPRVLTDISFQLSFLATFGVLYVTPLVIHYVRFLPMRFGLRELVATTIAATITVLPILLYTTGILSLVSLPANIFILPFIPLTMLFNFLTGIVGFVSTLLALPFAYVSHLLLLYILSVIHIFASLPFAKMTIQSFPLVVTLVLYALIGYWVIKNKKKS
jgi:competence protein ComEC